MTRIVVVDPVTSHEDAELRAHRVLTGISRNVALYAPLRTAR